MMWLRKREPASPPDEIRAARQAAGWTHEQVADAMGVLPLEVSAWESGAVTPDRRQVDELRYRLALAEYEAGLPRSDCYWTRANQARLEQKRQTSPRAAEREVLAHARECAECMRVQMLLRDLPAAPEPPVEPGWRGWLGSLNRRIARLPLLLRAPLWAAQVTAFIALGFLGVHLVNWIQGEPGPDVSSTLFLVLFAGLTWAITMGTWLQPVSDERPRLAGHLFAAGLVLPAVGFFGARGTWDLSSPGLWIFAALVSVLLGWVTGRIWEIDPAGPTPEAPEEEEEEREVFIPQRDTSFRV